VLIQYNANNKQTTRFCRALENGVIGVPTYQITRNEGGGDYVIWGQDRLDMVEDLLSGWEPVLASSKKKHEKATRQTEATAECAPYVAAKL
jgi:hypothetical protein